MDPVTLGSIIVAGIGLLSTAVGGKKQHDVAKEQTKQIDAQAESRQRELEMQLAAMQEKQVHETNLTKTLLIGGGGLAALWVIGSYLK